MVLIIRTPKTVPLILGNPPHIAGLLRLGHVKPLRLRLFQGLWSGVKPGLGFRVIVTVIITMVLITLFS